MLGIFVMKFRNESFVMKFRNESFVMKVL